MRPGLILELRPAAFHQQFQKVESPQIHRGLRFGSNLADPLHQLIDRRFGVDFVQHAIDLRQERIDLTTGVPNHGIRQAGEQTEILRGTIVAFDRSQTRCGIGCSGEVRLIGQQVFRCHVAGVSGAVIHELQQGVLVHGLINRDLCLGILGVLLRRLIPGCQGAIICGAKLTRRLQSLKLLDGVVELAEFGIQIPQRLLPAMVRGVGSGPLL